LWAQRLGRRCAHQLIDFSDLMLARGSYCNRTGIDDPLALFTIEEVSSSTHWPTII
jgi:hypothetical protein